MDEFTGYDNKKKRMTTKELLKKQCEFYHSNQSKSVRFRVEQLKKLRSLLKENEHQLYIAIDKDFGKSQYETYITELSLIYHEINLAIKKVSNWGRPKYVWTNLANFPGKSRIIYEPFGNVLVIGAWNYPYQLSLVPTISAIAAGNTVVLKPSELSLHTSNLMARLINENFNSGFLYVKEGGVKETSELLSERFDKIFFTGSTAVGKIVMQAAANHLTPVTLELGGKSPVFVLPDASLKMTAKRIAWGKFLNAGQTCVAPDYVLVHSEIKERFLSELKNQIEQIHGLEPKGKETYVRIINKRHYDRLYQLIHRDKIYFGGEVDPDHLYISPTILDNISFNDKVMEDEIFGPILPVIEFTDLEEIIKKVKTRPDPLALYVFTKNRKIKEKLISEISFGGGSINDTILHLSNSKLPFGGKGPSGIGNYHGKAGFDTFSHKKSILYKGLWFEPFLKYKPYHTWKLNLLKMIFE